MAAARRQFMVGRREETALFRAALKAREPEFVVLHVYGPGGVGKSTLLREYRQLVLDAGRPVRWVEGRDLDPSPGALRRALGEGEGATPIALEPGTVVLIDGYEYLAPLDGWLREQFLPDLPAGCLVVIGGREPPAAPWRSEMEWSALCRVIALRNLAPAESKDYLRKRKIAAARHASILDFTHGHPLALSLLADVLARDDKKEIFDPRQQPDVLRALLDRLVRDMPGPGYRRALEACAHARVTTEALLMDVAGAAEAHVLFEWLRGLSLIEQGPEGLQPHDLVREVLDADLRWRDRDGYRDLHRQVREHVLRRLSASSGAEQQRAFFDLLFLHRYSPVMRPYYEWKSLGDAYSEAVREADHAPMLKLIREQQGEASAQTASYWLRRQPEGFRVFRSDKGESLGFAHALHVRDVSDDDVATDALLRKLIEHARRTAPLRAGEALVLHRFWARGSVQPGPAVLSLLAMVSTNDWLTTPALGWSFVVVPDGPLWDPMFGHLNLSLVAAADHELNGHLYRVYAHDWRAEPPPAWLEQMAERELATSAATAAKPIESQQRLVLSEPDFADVVRHALRDYTRPGELSANPLLRSRVLLDRVTAPTAADLQALLREGVELLRANPKDEKRYRALLHTFLQPAATQEQAAERLGLPFNTYRYHLYQGIERLTAWLWQRELRGPGS